jgi:hypothetical protein
MMTTSGATSGVFHQQQPDCSSTNLVSGSADVFVSRGSTTASRIPSSRLPSQIRSQSTSMQTITSFDVPRWLRFFGTFWPTCSLMVAYRPRTSQKDILYIHSVTSNLLPLKRLNCESNVYFEFHPWYFHLKDWDSITTKKFIIYHG